MENSTNQNQENFDPSFTQQNPQRNFFFERNKEIIVNAINDGSLDTILVDIDSSIRTDLSILKQDDNNDKIVLSPEAFKLLGSIAYFFGIDFTSSQNNIPTMVLDNVRKRFDGFKITRNQWDSIYNFFNNVNLFDLLESNNGMQKGLAKPINIKTPEIGKALRVNVLKLINNCVFKIESAVDIDRLKSLKIDEYTYKTIIEINGHINSPNTTFLAGMPEKYYALYGMKDWQELVNKALEYTQDAKFGVVYFESILSVYETFKRFEIGENDMCNIVSGALFKTVDNPVIELPINDSNESDEELFEEENLNEGQSVDKVLEDIDPLYEQPIYTEGEYENLLNMFPDKAIAAWLKDINKSTTLSAPKIINAISYLLQPENQEAFQNIYSYLAMRQQYPQTRFQGRLKEEVIAAYNIEEKSFEDFVAILKESIEPINAQYKENMEIICAPINKSTTSKLHDLLRIAINDCVTTNETQKQYLLSNYFSIGEITTYNQLQQVIGLIESCQISGDDVSSYANLYKFLEQDEEIVDIFAKVSATTEITNKIDLINRFIDWFSIIDKYDWSENVQEGKLHDKRFADGGQLSDKITE